ncbi:ABC transporter permease [Terribacillus saccharophilus]|uniref:Iron ABC transporter permease n=1 Tax=Terribacillus saccharophilus TaxID=361277 RepID=A0A075LPX9_9BACI|nr:MULTISPECIES: ABC transporter permease [Terribacillus]AIF68166.1 iron ABC transporter permease [Terribacillus goriensis]MCM3226388.1 ABC transporter permease [Terribacillus saccharophilus]MEC0301936.1 ABC transporter permease [Terribacillus saccharophilus]SEN18857.1 iron complex transport system permease protein [Terribacillus saccharophilus]
MKLIYLFIITVLLAVCSLFVGVENVSFSALWNMDEEAWNIVMISRLPRMLSIIMAGTSLSICGLIMQQLTQNKFVSPTTAGTMDWARLGILVSLLFFTDASPIWKMCIAAAFALFGTLLFMGILQRLKQKDTIFIPLVGIMLGNVVSSIATFFALKFDLVQNMSSWLQGDFSLIMEGRYELLYISVPLLIIAFLFANMFTVAGMGEDFATNLGLPYKYVVNVGLIIVAIITAVVILTVGVIPFLGLIVPNIVSIYRGDNLKNSIWHTAVLGAAFLLVCDIAGRLIIYPYEISVGLMVGVIGTGIFLYMLLRRNAYA